MNLSGKLCEVHDAVKFNATKHTYEVDGQSMVAVTTAGGMLDKPGLLWGAVKLTKEGKNHQEVWNREKEIGTKVHRAFENAILRSHGLLTLPEQHTAESAYLSACVSEWLDKVSEEIKWFVPERRLYHPTHGYAGTMDAPALWLGCPTIFDVKTCKDADSFYDDWLPQNAAYRAAAEFHTGVEWNGAIIRVPKSGEPPNILPLGNDSADFDAFLHLLGLYKWSKRKTKKGKAA